MHNSDLKGHTSIAICTPLGFPYHQLANVASQLNLLNIFFLIANYMMMPECNFSQSLMGSLKRESAVTLKIISVKSCSLEKSHKFLTNINTTSSFSLQSKDIFAKLKGCISFKKINLLMLQLSYDIQYIYVYRCSYCRCYISCAVRYHQRVSANSHILYSHGTLCMIAFLLKVCFHIYLRQFKISFS